MAETASITTGNRLFPGIWDDIGQDDSASPDVPKRRVPDATTVETTELDIPHAGAWLFEEINNLELLRQIPDHWESGGAAPPNDTAIARATEVLTKLAEIDFRPDHIDPSTDEGVCLSFRRGKKYGDIECFNSGDIFALVSPDDGDSNVWEVKPGEVNKSLEKIRNFFYE